MPGPLFKAYQQSYKPESSDSRKEESALKRFTEPFVNTAEGIAALLQMTPADALKMGIENARNFDINDIKKLVQNPKEALMDMGEFAAGMLPVVGGLPAAYRKYSQGDTAGAAGEAAVGAIPDLPDAHLLAGLPLAKWLGNKKFIVHGTPRAFERFDTTKNKTFDLLGRHIHGVRPTEELINYADRYANKFPSDDSPVGSRPNHVAIDAQPFKNTLDLIGPKEGHNINAEFNWDDFSQALASLPANQRERVIKEYKYARRDSRKYGRDSLINNLINELNNPETMKRTPFDAIRVMDEGHETYALNPNANLRSYYGKAPLVDNGNPLQVTRLPEGTTSNDTRSVLKLSEDRWKNSPMSLADSPIPEYYKEGIEPPTTKSGFKNNEAGLTMQAKYDAAVKEQLAKSEPFSTPKSNYKNWSVDYTGGTDNFLEYYNKYVKDLGYDTPEMWLESIEKYPQAWKGFKVNKNEPTLPWEIYDDYGKMSSKEANKLTTKPTTIDELFKDGDEVLIPGPGNKTMTIRNDNDKMGAAAHFLDDPDFTSQYHFVNGAGEPIALYDPSHYYNKEKSQYPISDAVDELFNKYGEGVKPKANVGSKLAQYGKALKKLGFNESEIGDAFGKTKVSSEIIKPSKGPSIWTPKKFEPQEFVGGSHGAQKVKFGDSQYIFKPTDEIPGIAEQYGSTIGNLLNKNIPIANYDDYTGYGLTKGTLQDFKQGKMLKDAFSPYAIAASDPKQLAENHVIDWLIGNHDTHAAQFLYNEGNIIPVDKGQSFKYWKNEKLDPDYNPNYNYGQLKSVYNDLQSQYPVTGWDASYNFIKKNVLPKEQEIRKLYSQLSDKLYPKDYNTKLDFNFHNDSKLFTLEPDMKKFWLGKE